MTVTNNDSDESLMGRVCRGDQQAFAFLVERHSGLFFSAAYRMCQHEQLAEDVLQEAFLKLWKNPGGFDPDKGVKFTTWFYRVVTNLAIDRMRKQKPQSHPAVLEFMADGTMPVDEAIVEQQKQKRLEAAISHLPERQKIALNLCFYEGLSNKEAADILGVGIKALESLLMRAKSALKAELLPDVPEKEYEVRRSVS